MELKDLLSQQVMIATNIFPNPFNGIESELFYQQYIAEFGRIHSMELKGLLSGFEVVCRVFQ